MKTAEILFLIVVFLSNIIQGITGFAGTILAMPFGIMLVGFDTAKPILNVLGILAGLWVAVFNFKKIQWKEFLIIVAFMIPSMICGILLHKLLVNQAGIMYKLLGAFVIGLAVVRTIKLFIKPKESTLENKVSASTASNENPAEENSLPVTESEQINIEDSKKLRISKGLQITKNTAYLISAGIVHGMFVSGGPLLIGYLSGKLKDKDQFRATISTVWILLNSMILVSDIMGGMWKMETVKLQAFAIPFLFAGMFVGGKLCKIMSQKVFLILTYVLLLISGVTLMFK